MLKAEIRFTGAALEHIDRIADYHLLMVGPQSAERITDALLDAFDQLREYPLSGAEHPDPVLARYGYRKLNYGDYVGVYKLIDSTVYVYGIFHGSTDYPKLFR